MRYLYVQAQFLDAPEPHSSGTISFRHTWVYAADDDSAYIQGQRVYPKKDPAARLLNDYVIPVPVDI